MPASVPYVPFDANVAVRIATVLAGDAPTVSDWDSATDVSCYLAMDGFAYSTEQATITFDALCADQTFAKPGRKTPSLSLSGIDNTNTEYEAEYNELAETMTEGADRVVLARYGMAFDAPAAADQKVHVIPITVGMKALATPETNSAIRATWSTFVSGAAREVALTA